ncbi:PH domain-containing protein [Salinibacterium sp. NSLL150]|uniref:PH domain-containing protein n=1 Tax=unclassified Salinibacterium TaxID=2632331 RepID=UPI0018CDB830|nr:MULTISPECIES: PH domain-containing protein [unclassified Salinibacterium]MBH0098496.1 PH domain-containing protein [Salinibacterium sp. NSLL35]MBH0101251.1 PH domain-containing protein [Salinibacterium sp. NSLL150]MBH0104010.1 PH domain-containing protein [Salinibacterium sp. NSLL16]MBH0106771.1 PH domain-containing protein [Salinibacterium sp. NSLL17]MBH0109457.1 PH domain-containing protein [Salinibacterium sp. NG22]
MPNEMSVQREAIVARVRSHARALTFPGIIFVATAGTLGYFFGSFPEDWQNLALLTAGLLLIVVAWFLPFFGWLARNYTITTRRVVLSSGVFVRIRQELLHSRGYDVTVRQSWIQRMFGSGDLLINAGHDHPVVLRDIPSVALTQAALHDLMENNQNVVSLRRQREESQPSDETAVWGTR